MDIAKNDTRHLTFMMMVQYCGNGPELFTNISLNGLGFHVSAVLRNSGYRNVIPRYSMYLRTKLGYTSRHTSLIGIEVRVDTSQIQAWVPTIFPTRSEPFRQC